MSRLQLFEFNDAPWTPAPLRETVVEFLHHMALSLDMYGPGFRLVADLVEDIGADRVQLLCAGGGGGAQQLVRELDRDAKLVLSDRFPNPSRYAELAAEDPRIDYVADPVDVRAVPESMAGVRVIVNAIHHLEPADVRAVIADAVAKSQALVFIEPVQRELLATLRFCAAAPALCVGMSLGGIRPLTARRVALGALAPVGTMALVFDGVVSHLRAYTLEEWRAMAAAVDVDGRFDWRFDALPGALGSKLTVMVGVPKDGGAQ
ncbi:hypothetical protein G6O69_28270 [Pseudenhygromyxa sp. WMMC2535]|uniref:hypothetical protein n=1 Tax=Pseudenhygromyxa sp. WMMC2535 TaxID=2712867 RepID=UPI0015569C69|nr:hypothetical protein [Pseudenhygromyxa sp. WMMC2535]NVB41762.1 hypothetical protein [Pseudenhygromyxa sp. WMMC2535]